MMIWVKSMMNIAYNLMITKTDSKNRIKVNKNKIYNVYISFYFCWISLCVKLQDVSLLIVIYRQLSFTKKIMLNENIIIERMVKIKQIIYLVIYLVIYRHN